ncbi:MAG: metallophosphoesterase [Deltaproteobacteria bacterium]|nr:metallophosphoesterase [Deltaproteobacteria bacterium]
MIKNRNFFSTAVFSISLLFLTMCSDKNNSPVVDNNRIILPDTVNTVIAIGDIHGDINALKSILIDSHAISKNLHWIGTNMIVVQTGDILDRGDNELQIIELLFRLKKEAPMKKSQLILINGNHEIMNFAGDFRYVSQNSRKNWKNSKLLSTDRESSFKRGEYLALEFSKFPVVTKVGSLLFTHGGLTIKQAEYGIEKINSDISKWLTDNNTSLPAILRKKNSPFWNRTYGKNPDSRDCRNLQKILELTKSGTLIIGHSIQKNGINSKCNGLVWRIDVGMSKYYGSRNLEYLEITRSGITKKSSGIQNNQ